MKMGLGKYMLYFTHVCTSHGVDAVRGYFWVHTSGGMQFL